MSKIDKARDLIIDEAVNEFKSGNISSSGDVECFLDNLIGPILQSLLEAELDQHLQYNKHEKKNENSKVNTRNGYCKEKKVKTKYGETPIKTPRDRDGSFDPVLVPKKSNVFTGVDDACVSLYAKGMSTRDIENIIKQLYNINLSKDQVSYYVSKVREEVVVWQERKLKNMYAFVYADCLYYPIKGELSTKKHAVYLLIGITLDGYKEVLGFWRSETESATFWTTAFEDIKSRGVKDILYICSDGIAGFKSSIDTVYPNAITQRCIVHLVRNLISCTPKKIVKDVIKDFKDIYTSITEEEADEKLDKFLITYKDYPKVIKQVNSSMQYIYPLFDLPAEIRKVIYTTNLIESVNSTLRRVTNNKGAFNSEDSLFNLLYLRIMDLEKKWTKPIQNHKLIFNQLLLLHKDRIYKHYDSNEFKSLIID